MESIHTLAYFRLDTSQRTSVLSPTFSVSLALRDYNACAEAVVSHRCTLTRQTPLLFFAEVGWLDYKEHETSFEKGQEILNWYTFFKMAILAGC